MKYVGNFKFNGLVADSFAYAAATGSTNAYAVTLAPAISAYTAGLVINFKANAANTGAATINANSVGNVTIKKNGSTDLAIGDIANGQIATVIYDGTYFQLCSRINSSSVNAVEVTVDFGSITGRSQETTTRVTVTGQSWVTATSKIVCTAFGGTTVEHDPDDAGIIPIYAVATNRVAGVGFDVMAYAPDGTYGRYLIHCIGV